MGFNSIDILGNNVSVTSISETCIQLNGATIEKPYSFFKSFFLKKKKIEVSLIYSVLLISAVQQSDLIIYIYIFFSILFSILGYPRILNRVPCAKQYGLVYPFT